MLRSGLAVHALPQTFQDAASVCQKLGFRYLWIDSLCISQDNLTDWASEARQMKEIYSNAVFTIAATASQDGRGGLFRHRSAGLMPPVLVEVTELNDLLPDKEMPYLSGTDTYLAGCTSNAVLDITMAPLNTRAWVIQERYLSTRTMHFSENLLYWECQESFVNELYPTELPSAGQGFDMIDIRPSKTMKLFYAGSACVPKKSEPDKDCLDNSWRERDELIYNNWTSLLIPTDLIDNSRHWGLMLFSNETAEHNSRGPVFVNTDEPLPDATKGYRHGVVAVSIFCCRNDDSELKWVEGLVLKPSATQPDAYERIGHFYTGGDPDCRHGAQRVWTQHERANYRVIRVV
ncbi:hypothetical protein N0V95_004329 [Ascochyta clinopodiicola]|nr:hypothetical protein N0V95_004329 [Ascochyta clinopodiicola]